LLAGAAKAQVSIIQYPLQNLQMKPSDMFRADILNTDNKTVQLYLTGTIVNSQNGQKLVSAKSRVIDVPPGSKQLSENMLQAEYTITTASIEQTGNLPYGNYTICLKAFLVGGLEEAATACEDVELMPLSPPLLLSPENQSTIREEYPLLIWLPPMPVGKDKVLYDLKLVELLPNQTAYDAIQKNYAILEQRNINGTTLQYPASAMKLETGKKYAWKVIAVSGNRKPIGETEVWWFTLNEKPKLEKGFNEGVVLLKRSDDAEYYPVIGDTLRLSFYEKYNTKEFSYKIYDAENNLLDPKCLELAEKKTGDNMVKINLVKCDNFKEGRYSIEVVNEKGEVFRGRFKYSY
jgi:hypothetical protein